MTLNPRKLGVLIIHGIGNQPPIFADPMISKLRKELVNPDAVAFQTIHWAPILEERSQSMWDRLCTQKMSWKKSRKLFLNNLSDATAYNGEIYEKVHDCIEASMRRLQEDLRSNESIPIVVIAHSLGCAMISDYIWDRQKAGNDDDRYSPNIQAIFTMGCNIPAFALSHVPIEAIDWPHLWLNFYDKDDILGYPLKPLGDSYDKAVNEDIEVNVGNPLVFWNPLCHDYYWTSKKIVDRISEVMNLFIA